MLEDFAANLKMARDDLNLVALHIITATGAKIMLYRDRSLLSFYVRENYLHTNMQSHICAQSLIKHVYFVFNFPQHFLFK